jgi:alpha-mannosidase
MRPIHTLQSTLCFFALLPVAITAGPADVVPITRIDSVRTGPLWLKDGTRTVQPVTVTVWHTGPNMDGSFFFGQFNAGHFVLQSGSQTFELKIPVSGQPQTAALSWTVDGIALAFTNLTLTPPRIREVWLLPHSHVDIGYTDRQDKVVEHQMANLEKGMELARASATNAPGMRFKWNVEAAWTVDNFLQRATPAQRDAFVHAVQAGQVEVDTLYANILTGLCQPEELAQSLDFGVRLSSVTGRSAVSAMMCDVPGYTWGIVPMLAQAGVKYFAMGPNASARIGTIHSWDNKPFYWKSQSGRDRVLCWMVDNYHHFGDLEPHVLALCDNLNRSDFPYDMAYMFWVGRWPNGGVDNAPPDQRLVEKVQAWNAKYAAPRVIIGLESEFFGEFERRHSAQTPEFSGDLTPYWEDGTGSTARETAMNRASGDRLAQASALFAMRHPEAYPSSQFNQAWKNEMLYSEHTWGAFCSISKPDDPFTLDQWKVKQNFALQADRQSRELLAAALPKHDGQVASVDVFNTTQWLRTDLAVMPPDLAPGDMAGVTDENGMEVPSQRLASGEWVFVAKEVAPFGAKRFRLTTQRAEAASGARADGKVLATRSLRVELDPSSGAVKSLRLAGLDHEFVDANAPVKLNDFRYVLGTNAAGAQANGPVTISVLDSGPVIATLRIDSDAPGCNHLTRDVRVVEGLDQVEFIDRVDRKTVREKDAVHFGFGFDVPGGTLRMETPWAVVRPNADQLPGACRNWFTVQRWVDVSGNAYGINWASLDAPLLEIGGMTANLLGEVLPPRDWLANALHSQTIFSWAQNNHWFTNYKIDQPGVTAFRFILRPHQGGYSAAESTRFGLETTRPLIVAAAEHSKSVIQPLLTVSSPSVVVETVKISDDGKALILRLFDVSSTAATIQFTWGSIKPNSIWFTDLTEKPSRRADAPIQIPGYGVLSLRAELPL